MHCRIAALRGDGRRASVRANLTAVIGAGNVDSTIGGVWY